MNMRIKFIALAFVLFPMFATAQNSTLKFDEELWDFGNIEEVRGPVSHKFAFTNTGANAIVIEHISVSCGCTTPEFTTGVVHPGAKGEITVTYDPHNRPGRFNQEVHIKSNGGKNNDVVRIKGNVNPRPRTVEDDYPFETRAGLRFYMMSANFRYVEPGVPQSIAIDYINPTDKDITFDYELSPENPYLSVSGPATICAGCTGDITVTYLTEEGVYGRFTDRIYLILNGRKESVPLGATAFAVDKITGVSEARAPRAEIMPMFYNFGDVRRTAELSKRFTLRNSGRAPLVVRWMEHKAHISTSLREGTVIQPGNSIDFSISMDISEADRGPVPGSLSIITNDPEGPFREIKVIATVI